MLSYNKSSNIKYECYEFEKMLNQIDIIGSKYKIVDTIRSNNKKAVYLVVDASNIQHILKIRLNDFTTSDELNICKIIKHNPHPNINKIGPIYQTSKLFITVKEYINGSMLYHLKKIKLSETILLSLLKDILLGLQHLHNLNIAHGDISPYNIMVKSNNGIYFPIIIDFDHSILLDKTDEIDTKSFSGGTFGYVPPECVYGIRNDKSDIWALGETFKFINAYHSGEKINAIIELMTVEDHIVRPNVSDLLELLS